MTSSASWDKLTRIAADGTAACTGPRPAGSHRSDRMELSDDIRQFLLRNIDSVAELEALLLMRRETQTLWDARRLAARLYIDPKAANGVLDTLHRRGLLAIDGDEFSYMPVRDELRASVDALAEVYTRLLIPITHLLHSKPRPAVQQFADAFRLRDKE